MYVVVTIVERSTEKMVRVYGPFRSKHATERAARSIREMEGLGYRPHHFLIKKLIDIPEEDIEL
jgi:hypothetical protein